MKIAIFYHIYQGGFGALIYQQQLHRLYSSGLIKSADHIHFGINGNQEMFSVPDKAVVQVNQNQMEETDTLISLKEFCDKNPDYKILYLHTKGATRQTPGVNSWRLMVEYFVIDKWKECINELDSYDAISCSFGTEPLPHFTANFWWANSSYIESLTYDLLKSEERDDREFWIGSGKNIKPKSFHDLKTTNLYWDAYSETNYMK